MQPTSQASPASDASLCCACAAWLWQQAAPRQRALPVGLTSASLQWLYARPMLASTQLEGVWWVLARARQAAARPAAEKLGEGGGATRRSRSCRCADHRAPITLCLRSRKRTQQTSHNAPRLQHVATPGGHRLGFRMQGRTAAGTAVTRHDVRFVTARHCCMLLGAAC